VVSQIWEPISAKRMKVVDPYCQRQNFSSLNSHSSKVLILLGVPLLGFTIRIQWAKMAIFNIRDNIFICLL